MGVIPRNYAKLLGEMGSWSQPKLTRLRNRPARTGKVTMAAEDAGSQPVKKWHKYCLCPTMCACEGDDEYNPNDPWTFCQKITTPEQKNVWQWLGAEMAQRSSRRKNSVHTYKDVK